ncbi:MAG: Smr/MutS family protein [Chloroflexota bacterium]|nr:Smr/MutS family protein [Chloroflexota bacterium]
MQQRVYTEESEVEDGRSALRDRAQALLEFDVIRARVAERATFFPARQLALKLRPSYDDYEVAMLQQETAEGRAVLDEAGEVDMFCPDDIEESVVRASIGGILTGMELLAVAQTIDVQARAKSGVLAVRQHVPLLADFAESIPNLSELTRQILGRIGDRGIVRDDATHTLRALRSQIRQAYQRVTDSLNSLIQSAQSDNALQDNVISVRNDRLVVQVKAEMRSRVPGIVHDASNTGATLFVEPFSTVEIGNTWRELALAEEREIRKVLRDLSTLVGELARDIQRGSELTARLDLILARARYSYSIRGVRPLSPAELAPVNSGTANKPSDTNSNDADSKEQSAVDMRVRLINARHPMLGRDVVPVNVSVGPDWSVLVVTGPNTGGKTVAMKTVGLLALMHQAGLQIPADDGSVLPTFDGVYADVGDQQSIEQSVSTFSSHMRNVIEILGAATPESLILLDELGTSTDAEEGSALARAILEDLAGRKVSTIATTHHRSVAAFAETSPGMMNSSVQLDADSLTPTYHLTLGIPGRSYAMAIAASLGLPEHILENAQGAIEPQYLRFEDWLTELQRERNQLQALLLDAEQSRGKADELRQQLDEQIEYLITHRDDMVEGLRRGVLAQFDETQRRLKAAEASLSWGTPASSSGVVQTEGAREDIRRLREEIAAERAAVPPSTPVREMPRELEVGDKVFVRGLNLGGVLVSLPENGSDAEVGIGNVRIQVQPSRLSLIEQQPEQSKPEVSIKIGPMLDSTELDVRGMRADESLAELELFLDKAVRDGFNSVRVIHGRGKGILRNAVREHLTRHPLARSFEAEARERGGDGATLVHLA